MLTVLTGKVSHLTVVYKHYANIPGGFLLAQHHGRYTPFREGSVGFEKGKHFPILPQDLCISWSCLGILPSNFHHVGFLSKYFLLG